MRKFKKALKKLIDSKAFHISIISIIIIALIAVAVVIILRYNVEGEKEIPFEISKINVISSSSGEEMENVAEPARWNLNISQNNDFYIYIEKNQNYKGRKEEVIQSIDIENFEINRQKEVGEIKLYKPDPESEKELFKNTEQNEIQKIEYKGAPESNIKKLEMSNQGDLIYFRFTNKDIKEYASNDEELNYGDLLKKAEIPEEDLKATIKFDLTINLVSRKSFKTTITAELPVKGVVEESTASGEIIDVNKLIFKRN